jgi:hypothetical protein
MPTQTGLQLDCRSSGSATSTLENGWREIMAAKLASQLLKQVAAHSAQLAERPENRDLQTNCCRKCNRYCNKKITATDVQEDFF